MVTGMKTLPDLLLRNVRVLWLNFSHGGAEPCTMPLPLEDIPQHTLANNLRYSHT